MTVMTGKTAYCTIHLVEHVFLDILLSRLGKVGSLSFCRFCSIVVAPIHTKALSLALYECVAYPMSIHLVQRVGGWDIPDLMST